MAVKRKLSDGHDVSNGVGGGRKTKKTAVVAAKSKEPESSNSGEDSEASFGGLSRDEDDISVSSAGSEGEIEAAGKKPTRKGDVSDSKGAPKVSSKETHAKQKAVTLERKAAKPNADSIQRSKKLWERLRRKSHVPLAERKKLIKELFEIITGRVSDFVFKHDSVRVIQTAIKYANLEQRKAIARELKGNYKALAESRYAKFLIGKLLVHGDAEIRDLVIPEFYGSVRRLIKHPEASWIVDDVYRSVATPHQKASMLREWYGPEFSLFKTAPDKVTADLGKIFTKEPSKRAPVMKSLFELINQMVQKKTTGFTMLHDAMLQYFLNVKPGSEEATEFLEMIKGDEEGDLLKNLAFTKSGSDVVCRVLAKGNAKDRKLILRQYKDTFSLLSYDANGHSVIVTALEVIDDTVLTYKSIFPELIGKGDEGTEEKVLTASTDLNARIPLLYLLAGRAKWLMSKEELDYLAEIDEIRKETSKKEPSIRRHELLEKLSPSFINLLEKQASQLAHTSFGWQFIGECLLEAKGPKAKANEAVADAVSGDPFTEGHAAGTPVAGRVLRTLVAGGRFNLKTGTVKRVEPSLDFHNTLFAYIKPHIASWATGPSSFVVLDMIDADGFLYRDELIGILKKARSQLEATAGAARQSDTKATKKRKEVEANGKSKGENSDQKGNKGAAMILEKLQ